MKVFKILVLLSFIFCFFQCKKEKKVNVQANLLPNGKYILYLEEDSQSHSSCYYFLENNIFYVLKRYTKDTICFSRKAGELFLNTDGKTEIAPLQMSLSSNPCFFENDLYGGDTMIIHFSNVKELNLNQKNGLQGGFHYLVRSNEPFSKITGKFTLGPS